MQQSSRHTKFKKNNTTEMLDHFYLYQHKESWYSLGNTGYLSGSMLHQALRILRKLRQRKVLKGKIIKEIEADILVLPFHSLGPRTRTLGSGGKPFTHWAISTVHISSFKMVVLGSSEWDQDPNQPNQGRKDSCWATDPVETRFLL